MKLILHIGTEKTATTTLQHWLYSNQIELSKQRISLSNFLEEHNNRDLSAFFNSSIDDFFDNKKVTNLDEKRQYFDGFIDGFVAEINAISSNHNYMIITSEHFHSRLTDVDDIRALRDFLFLHFDDVKVICYFREQSLMRESLYSTALGCGDACSLVEFHAPGNVDESYYGDYYNYFIMFSKWESVFGINKLEPVIYDKKYWYDGDIRKDFIKRVSNQVNLDVLNYSVERLNEKFSYLQALLVRTVNSVFNVGKSSISIRNQLVSVIIENKSLAIGDLIDDRKIDFYNRFYESNELFFKKFFGKSGNLFKKPILPLEKSIFSPAEENALVDGLCDLITQMPLLFDDDANQLKDIALKYESYSLLSRDDALFLMGLAKRARPDGSFINLKVSEWESNNI